MKQITILAAWMISCLAISTFQTPNLTEKMKPDKEITLTILYDNYKYKEGFRNSWGFSCLIEGPGPTILFDTGGGDGNLMHNFKAAGKDPKMVDIIVLSHIHADHTGGIDDILKSKTGIDVYMPASFPADFQHGIEAQGAHPVLVSDVREISENVWSTGEMGTSIIEQ